MSTNLQRKHPQREAEQREDSREESAAELTATEEARQTTRAIKVMMGRVEASSRSLQETEVSQQMVHSPPSKARTKHLLDKQRQRDIGGYNGRR
ncbi:hypothetical protein RvY_15212 [Ramazzottius varieornatus]|uniref:Uncharacterized protein n=1 Tax=Ramazzottius varieornatus TaxID=947166 RepID=A0A1D1W111_RAMVA|nr:hypothetical protein RvY_15212 [Ramazzottius varieornatus]